MIQIVCAPTSLRKLLTTLSAIFFTIIRIGGLNKRMQHHRVVLMVHLNEEEEAGPLTLVIVAMDVLTQLEPSPTTPRHPTL